jgi:two-component system, NarL family, nitrate/nitrite response regulator NarL
MTNMIRAAVIDSYPIFRDGVTFTLEAQGDITVVAKGETAADAQKIAFETEPHVIVLDIGIKGGSLEAIETITAAHPNTKIIVLTMWDDPDNIRDAFRLGASGYCVKGTSGPEFIQAVRTVLAGETYLSPSLAYKALSMPALPKPKVQDRFSGLTDREKQVLDIISEGRSNKEIARTLDLSEKTVKHYVTNLMHKLGVRNRVEAALLRSNTHRMAAE